MTKHSRLGASGAERWMACPGSYRLLALLRELGLEVDESDEPDYQKQGTAMHLAAAHCLENSLEAWELVGEEFNGIWMTSELLDPVQTYLNYCRTLHGVPYIEYAISSPVHPLFFGTLDFAAVNPGLIHVVDLKGGEGIYVEVEDNPQAKYYAFGIIDGIERSSGFELASDIEVRIAIVQPRWHDPEDRVRVWKTTVGEIKAWVHGVLVPAMLAVEYDETLDAGEHCRFCPAKLVCPLLTSLFGAAANANASAIPNMNNEMLGRNYELSAAVKFYIKALEAEAYRRAMLAQDVPGAKLVPKRSNRVFKDGAFALAEKKFGKDKVYNPPEAKSPAQLEKLPGAGDWVKEFTYSPDTGLTLALASDKRVGVKVSSAVDAFAGAIAALED